jgi:hypothetical protein
MDGNAANAKKIEQATAMADSIPAETPRPRVSRICGKGHIKRITGESAGNIIQMANSARLAAEHKNHSLATVLELIQAPDKSYKK